MRKSRFTESQIVRILKEVDAGMKVGTRAVSKGSRAITKAGEVAAVLKGEIQRPLDFVN